MIKEHFEAMKEFLRDFDEMCCNYRRNGYQLGVGFPLAGEGMERSLLLASHSNADFARIVAAVEKWHESHKPCVEVIDKAVDIVTVEVQAEHDENYVRHQSINDFAEVVAAALSIELDYCEPTVTVTSAKRFALETHKEG